MAGGIAGLLDPATIVEGHRPRCPCQAHEIKGVRYLYLWAPGPVPLQLDSTLHSYLRPARFPADLYCGILTS